MFVDISEIDEDGPATRSAAGLHVARPVADHKRTCAVDAEPSCGAAEHAWFGLAAIALVALSVVASLDSVDREEVVQPSMHLFNRGAIDKPISDIGLICYYDEPKT